MRDEMQKLTYHSRFGRRVDGLAGQSLVRQDAGHVDDAARRLLEMGGGVAGRVDGAQQIGLKDPLYALRARFGEETAEAASRGVDQHIQTANVRLAETHRERAYPRR